MKKLLILGAGTAGTIMANKLSQQLNLNEWQITIVDKDETHYYQPGFLFIPFQIYSRNDLIKPARDYLPPSVEVLMDKDIELLHKKIDFLTESVMQTQRRQRELDELRQDLTPLASDIFKAAVEELDEVAPYFSYEDLIFLVKKLLRNTRNITALLEQMENAADFMKDALPLSKPLFQSVLETFDSLEQKGYFTFILNIARVFDKIVTSFTEKELKQLTDNVDSLIRSIKLLSQNNVIQQLENALTVYTKMDEPDIKIKSLLGLFKDLNSPQVRKPLTIGLTVVKQMSQQNEKSN